MQLFKCCMQKNNGITFQGRTRVFVDGANPSFIHSLKDRVNGEDPDYKQLTLELKNIIKSYEW